MKIKYAGLRPIISQHGISYKDGKEDKYVYLMVALEILQDIDNNYQEKSSYSKTISFKDIPEEQYHTILKQYDKDLEDEVSTEMESYKQKIQEEIKAIQARTNLTQVEKDAWCENIHLMTQYRIQRAINKIYYFHCIDDIKKIIKKEKIKKIQTPFNEKFWHVLTTIQGSLENDHHSIETQLKEENINNQMVLTLFIHI